MRITGLSSFSSIKEPGTIIKVAENPATQDLFYDKVSKYYKKSEPIKDALVLDWKDYYVNSLEARGLLKKKGLKKVKKVQEVAGNDLMNILENLN